MTSLPAVTVVVPFYNRRNEVARCLDAVLAQQLPEGMTMEVVAVDNGSTDGTRDLLASYPVRLVDCARRGPAAARNAGIAAAQAPIVALTDSDCVPAPDWLAHLLAPFSDPAVIAAGGRIEALSMRRGVAVYFEERRFLNQEKLFRGSYCYPPFVATANAAFRREVILAAGGFDESLRVGEDADLCWRALDGGGAIAYCPRALVRHGHRDTYREFFRQAMAYGEGAARVYARHRKRFGVRRPVDWENIIYLARVPLEILLRVVVCQTAYKRRSAFYDAIWRTGFTLGRWRGSLRNRVAYF
jgi:GT2 family glycosyltransferase